MRKVYLDPADKQMAGLDLILPRIRFRTVPKSLILASEQAIKQVI